MRFQTRVGHGLARIVHGSELRNIASDFLKEVRFDPCQSVANCFRANRYYSDLRYFGCGTTRRYGFSVFHPPGYSFCASSFETCRR